MNQISVQPQENGCQTVQPQENGCQTVQDHMIKIKDNECKVFGGEETDCSVCFVPFSQNQHSRHTRYPLPCGHISVCRKCIRDLSQPTKHIKCPFCKHTFPMTCSVTASIFDPDHFHILQLDNISLFSTQQDVQKQIETAYQSRHPIYRMTVRGSFMFYPDTTLADMGVVPGSRTIVWVLYATKP